LDGRQIERILGPVPTLGDYTKVTLADVQPVINAIKRKPNPKEEDFIPVPEDKIFINGFSAPIIGLIKQGLIRASLVEKYFNMSNNLTLGTEIENSLKEMYAEFRDQLPKLESDEIYNKLVESLCHSDKKSDMVHVVAVHTVLSYFFEQCTIFEG